MPAPAVRRLALAGAPALLLVCSLATAPAAALPPAPAIPYATATAVAVATGSVPGPESRGAAAELELVPASWVSRGWASSPVDPERAALAGVGLVLAGLVGAFGVGLSRRPEPVD